MYMHLRPGTVKIGEAHVSSRSRNSSGQCWSRRWRVVAVVAYLILCSCCFPVVVVACMKRIGRFNTIHGDRDNSSAYSDVEMSRVSADHLERSILRGLQGALHGIVPYEHVLTRGEVLEHECSLLAVTCCRCWS